MIIQIKSPTRVLFKDGVRSEFIFHLIDSRKQPNPVCFRCLSDHGDLDQIALPRTVELIENLVKGNSSNQMWDNYGVLADIVVSFSLCMFVVI